MVPRGGAWLDNGGPSFTLVRSRAARVRHLLRAARDAKRVKRVNSIVGLLKWVTKVLPRLCKMTHYVRSRCVLRARRRAMSQARPMVSPREERG